MVSFAALIIIASELEKQSVIIVLQKRKYVKPG